MIKGLEIAFGENNVNPVTVGTLGSYTQFFMSFELKGAAEFCIGKLPDGKLKDKFQQFFNVISSHNGLVSTAFFLSIIRAVCMNTVQMGLNDAEDNGSIQKFKHTATSLELITPEAVAKQVESWLTKSAQTAAMFKAIRAVPMNLDGFRSFAAGLFTNAGSDTLSTNSFNRITECAPLFSKGLGNAGQSAYDALNAITERFSGPLAMGDKSALGKRVAYANFGRGNDWKLLAVKILSAPEDSDDSLARTMARGEILYGDKLAVMAENN
jgi:hypothetical protein